MLEKSLGHSAMLKNSANCANCTIVKNGLSHSWIHFHVLLINLHYHFFCILVITSLNNFSDRFPKHPWVTHKHNTEISNNIPTYQHLSTGHIMSTGHSRAIPEPSIIIEQITYNRNTGPN